MQNYAGIGLFLCAYQTTAIYEVIEGRVIPDWKKFISSGENKQSLIRFLGDYIVKHINQNSSLQEGQSLYYSACKIMRVSASSCVLAKQLQFNILTVSGLENIYK
jgi:hypothetical protein